MSRAHLAAPLLFLSACTGLAEQTEADRAAVAATLHDRTGIHLPAPTADAREGGIAPEVRELLRGDLTEASALRIAVLNNRRVQAALAELGVARAELVQAGLLHNPVFAVETRLFRGGTEIELGLSQSFLDLFLLPARRAAAAAEREAVAARVTRELVHLAFQVRAHFVRLRAAATLVARQREIVAAAQASAELMQRLHAAGNVTDPQLTAEEVALARARLELHGATQAAREAREPLNQLLGLWGGATMWTVAGELHADPLQDLPTGDLESVAIARSLDLAEQRARIDAMAQEAGLRSWEAWLGPAELGAVATREPDSSSWGVGPAASVSLPLWDRGGAVRAAADARLHGALHDHTALAVEVRSAARLLRDRAVAEAERTAFLGQVNLPLRSRLLRETLQNYNAMQTGAFAVLLARQQELEAVREHVTALRDAWLARLSLEELLAGSLDRAAATARNDAAGQAAETRTPGQGH